METRTDTLWTTGKLDTLVALQAQVRNGELFLVTADTERLTRTQFERGLRQCWPDTTFTIRCLREFWSARPL